MQRLMGASELIDDGDDAAQLVGTLRDLVRINLVLGGAELSWRALLGAVDDGGGDHCGGGGALNMLDVGSGAGDIPRRLLRNARRCGLQLSVTATDVRADVVELARRWSAGTPRLTVEQVPPDSLPYPVQSFDVVHASLVLHHLEPRAAIQLLAEMGRVARRAVIVNDLVRARRWWLAAVLLTHVATTNRYTRNDAPLSVRRAYRADEVVGMADAAGLRPDGLWRDRLGHRYALVLRPR